MTARGRCTAVGAVLLLALAGCGSTPTSTDDTTDVRPTAFTTYMDLAVRTYDTDPGSPTNFTPVTKDGRTWTGDPRTYEKVCAATFLAKDGSVPALGGAPDGSELAKAGDETYYAWLQRHPDKWGAFNAWLRDPAVVGTIGPLAERASTGVGFDLDKQVGDASRCTHAEDAGTPAG